MEKGLSGNIAKAFLQSKLTILLMVAFLLIGGYATMLIPREEEPQIQVPMADIFIGYPGASPKEVETKVAAPMEKIISNIKGVEYVYSTSMNGQVMLIVQFFVGEDVERSMVKLYTELMKHMDVMPQGVSMPLIKTRSIDDVPVLGFTLWGEQYDDYRLKLIGQELANEIKKITSNSDVEIKIKRGDLLGIKISSLNPSEDLLYNSTSMGALENKAGYLVDQKGCIRLHNIGEIIVEDLTVNQLSKILEKELFPYLKDRIVSISFLNRGVLIFGEVGNPQLLPLDKNNITIIEAITSSGSITDFANGKEVLIIRSEGDKKTYKTVNLEDVNIIKSPWYYLQNGDMVYIKPDNKKSDRINKANNIQRTLTSVMTATTFILILYDRFLKK